MGSLLQTVGGVLVYSTCTLTPEENEEQVADALARFPCLELVAAEPRLGSPGRRARPRDDTDAGAEGRAGGTGGEAATAVATARPLSDEQLAMVQRFEPSDGHEGFFIAKFRKACALSAP